MATPFTASQIAAAEVHDVKKHGPLLGTVSRFEGNVSEVPGEALVERAAQLDAQSKKTRLDSKDVAELNAVKAKNPMWKFAGLTRMAAELSEDVRFYKFAHDAGADLKAIPHEDGTIDVGVLKNGKRQGLWTTTKDGKRVRQGEFDGDVEMGTHREFQPDGKNVASATTYQRGVPVKTGYRFNGESVPVERTVYKDGGAIDKVEAIDPGKFVAEREAAKQEKAAAAQAMRGLKF